MFHWRRYHHPQFGKSWQYRKDPVWIVCPWQSSWRLRVDNGALVSTRDLMSAIEIDNQFNLSRHRFQSRRQALAFLQAALENNQQFNQLSTAYKASIL